MRATHWNGRRGVRLIAGLAVLLTCSLIGCTQRPIEEETAAAEPSAAGAERALGAGLRTPPNQPTARSPALSPREGGTGRPVGRTGGEVGRPAPSAASPVAASSAKVTLEALTGSPFGVGRVAVEFPEGSGPTWYPDQILQETQEGRRALYPAFAVDYEMAEGAPKYRVQSYACYFLFHGDQAVRLTLAADRKYDVVVKPVADAERHRMLLAQWWSRFRTAKKAYLGRYGSPKLLHGYLKNMLQRRLSLPDDEPAPGDVGLFIVPIVVTRIVFRALFDVDPLPLPGAGPPSSSPQQASVWSQMLRGKMDTDFGLFLGVLFGMESIRVAMQADEMLSDAATREIADREMPARISLPPIAIPHDGTLTDVEAIAQCVPEECFYVRCGSVADYFWLRNLVTDWGGSVDHLISMRALDHEIRPRLERQLALSSDPKFRQELDKCISDMALIGTDTFFHEGAAIGVLWEASDGAALQSLLRRQRKTAWESTPQAVQREIESGGKVESLSTPDNTVRSYYAIDGSYHFVTNSSYLVKRFFEACRGVRNLSSLREFRYARSKMPLDRDDVIFIYLSDPFFRLLVGPEYRVEMTRRMRALGDLQLVQMAQLAARMEGVEAKTPAELVRHGFLPLALLDRSDGSRPAIQDGRPIDSLRGAAGVFVPVPDVPVSRITAVEDASYRQFAGKYRSQWQRMDPVILGMSRRLDPDRKRERVLMDVQITPYAREHYQAIFQALGQRDRRWRVPVPGELLTLDMRVGNLSQLWSALPYGQAYLFGGLRDFSPRFAISDGQVDTVPLGARALLGADYPAYLGLKGRMGQADPLRSLDRHAELTDVSGYSQSRDAIFSLLEWRFVGEDGTIAWAHRKNILEAVIPPTMEDTERPAQIRFRLGDLGESKFGPALQAICYLHARRISATNTQLLAELTQQLGVPAAEARLTAEQLLGAKLVCPLGGEYRLDPQDGAVSRWTSTGWPRASVYEETAVPGNYRFSFLQWLHGAEIYFDLTPTVLSVHAELEVTASANAEPIRARPRPKIASRPKPYVAKRPVAVPSPTFKPDRGPIKINEPARPMADPARTLEPKPGPIKTDEPAKNSMPSPWLDGKITFDVDVPDGALVFVNGAATRSKGRFRQYVSLRLASGVPYSYEFRVLMTRDGQRVEQIQKVSLGAGETRRLIFTPEQATPIDTSFSAGDIVLVSADRAPLAVGDTVLSRIAQGRQLTVLQTQGDWIWTSIDDGRRIEGWMPVENVILFARTAPSRGGKAD